MRNLKLFNIFKYAFKVSLDSYIREEVIKTLHQLGKERSEAKANLDHYICKTLGKEPKGFLSFVPFLHYPIHKIELETNLHFENGLIKSNTTVFKTWSELNSFIQGALTHDSSIKLFNNDFQVTPIGFTDPKLTLWFRFNEELSLKSWNLVGFLDKKVYKIDALFQLAYTINNELKHYPELLI